MDVNLKNITQRIEFKCALFLACAVFFISFIAGILNGVEISVLIKRIFLAEIIFIPMGIGIGYILNTMILATPASIKSQISESTSDVNINPEKEKEFIVPKENVKTEEHLQSKDNRISGAVENVEIESEKLSEAPEMSQDILSGSDIAEEVKKLKSNDEESLGKYILVEDRKIVNNPEILAKTIRTMMNKE